MILEFIFVFRMNLATVSVQKNNSILDIEQDDTILSQDSKRKFHLVNIKEQKKLDFIVINKLIETLNNVGLPFYVNSSLKLTSILSIE